MCFFLFCEIADAEETWPPRLRISPNNTHLTLLGVHRDNPDGTSDIKVIQCNASNTHGTAYGNGYINILSEFLQRSFVTFDLRCVCVCVCMCLRVRA